MSWLKNYHDDHMSVMQLLAKLEGNMDAMAAGIAGQGVKLEMKEFGEVIQNVILPHFNDEEKTVYVETSKKSDRHRNFIFHMLDDHRKLYEAFDGFLKALEPFNQDKIIESGRTIVKILRTHITEEERVLPELAKEQGEE